MWLMMMGPPTRQSSLSIALRVGVTVGEDMIRTIGLALPVGYSDQMETKDILVVGAGVSGLMAARAAQAAGRSVQVLEAGYGPGGRLQSSRMATTCGSDLSFDHGAQFVTFSSDLGKEVARAAQAAGRSVQVLEAGYGPGGRLQSSRMATTCGSDLSFDHGAQFVTFSSDLGKEVARGAMDAGVLGLPDRPFGNLSGGVWADASEDPARPRLVGKPDMPAFAVWLTQTLALDLQPGIRIVKAIWQDGIWTLVDSRDRLWQGRGLILAMPPADQPDLEGAPSLTADARLRPCWAVHLAFEEEVPLVNPRAFVTGDDVIGFLAKQTDYRLTEKAGRCRLMLHSTHDYAERVGNDYPASKVIDEALTALTALLGQDLPPLGFSGAHYWPHAFVDKAVGQDHLLDEAHNLAACGDWCLGPRVEAAMLSGDAAGRCLAGAIR